MRRFLPLFFLWPALLPAQIAVADQTLKIDGAQAYAYAFAEGDDIALKVQLLVGRQLKAVEFVQFPDNVLFRSYELDTVLDKTIRIPRTGVYVLRLQETGLSKKVCRFTLHRTPATDNTARFETRVGWDLQQYPQYQERRRTVPAGKKTEMVSLGGQATVSGSKLGLKKPVNAYQFELPPNTVQWAFRLSVGQAGAEARRKDAEKLNTALKSAATKIIGFEPETALAAFALGMALDLTVSHAGEDVEYALLDAQNLPKFNNGEPYDAYLWQGGVTVDVQRRYAPLAGTCFFALRSNNWLDDINVLIDIEAVTEKQLFAEEIYLEPVRP